MTMYIWTMSCKDCARLVDQCLEKDAEIKRLWNRMDCANNSYISQLGKSIDQDDKYLSLLAENKVLIRDKEFWMNKWLEKGKDA